MSFYQTGNSSKFVRQNQALYASQHLQFLRSGFQQPFSVEAYTYIDGENHQYTVTELLNRYIVRTNNFLGTDVLPTATQIVEAIKNQQDVRQLAQDSSAIVPQPGFFWDVCFSIPATDESYQMAIVSPNLEFEIDPAVDGLVTITNCIESDPEPTFPIIFLQPGVNIWVRVTLVNVIEGSYEVNFSVLTNNCYLNPEVTSQEDSSLVQTVQKARAFVQEQREIRNKKLEEKMRPT